MKNIAAHLVRLFRARNRAGDSSPRRILLMRSDRLGDAIITLPLINRLHHAFPEAEIDVLASPLNVEFLRGIATVSRVYAWSGSPLHKRSLIARLRRRNYDLTIQCRLNRTTLPGMLAGILTPRGRTVGRKTEASGQLYDLTVPINGDAHFARQTVSLADPIIGEPAGSLVWNLPQDAGAASTMTNRVPPLADPMQRTLLVNLSAGNPSRQLAPETAAAAAAWAADKGWTPLLLCMPTEEELAVRIRAENASVYVLSGLSITELVETTRLADVLLTPDTATTHIASAVGTPALCCFSSDGHPEGWRPLSPGSASVVAEAGRDASAIGFGDLLEYLEGATARFQ